MTRLLLCLTLLAACGGKSEPANSGDEPADKPAAKLPDDAVANANAAVPEALKGKLEFIAGSFSDDDVKLLAPLPKGWEMSKVIPGSYKAPEGLGFRTKYTVGSSCDGSCEAKDWVAATEHEVFGQFKSGFTVESDAKADGMRTLVASNDGAKYIAVAKWKSGAKRYFSCTATLDLEAAAAAPAFEKACRALTPEW